MMEMLDLITPGDVLHTEFMEPLGVSQNRLARDIDVSTSHIHGIIHGTRSITAETAMRLAAYFKTTPQLWLNLQTHYDLEKAERDFWPKVKHSIRQLTRRMPE